MKIKTRGFPNPWRRYLPLGYILALLLTSFVGFIGYSTSRNIEDTLTQQFNQQQLILARKVSDHIQNQVSSLETTLLNLKDVWELGGAGLITQPDGIITRSLKKMGGDVLGILALDVQGQIIFRVTDPGWNPEKIPVPPLQPLVHYRDSRLVSNRVWIGNTFSLADKWVLLMTVPVAQKGKEVLVGALVFVVDAIRISQKATQGVVSGSTGYAWVINPQGIFLDHYEPDFIGKNSFTVRQARNPKISYQAINKLMRDELLKRKEGSSRYVSGWHRRNIVAETEKFISYTPIPFYETPERNLRPQPLLAPEFWSVALVAPTQEVTGMTRTLHFRQAVLMGIFQLLIILGTGLMVFISNRWSKVLQVEVEKKTEELQKSQEKLIHSERLAAVGTMASHVSHEIKNPLIAIGGLAQQLKRSPNLGEKEKGKLDLITGEVTRLENILIEVKDFTRPTVPHKIKAQINNVIEEVIQLFSPQLTQKKVEVKTSLASDLPDFDFDPEQIKQVLLNLIKNASEAMPEGGTIRVATTTAGDQVFVEVSDTGTGIPTQSINELFRPFFTTKKGGTGLGLAVSYKLIQDHNGDIKIKSEPNQGTIVTIQIPLRR
jgi:two-component system, NtrC family, sensor histidine kinase HydH